jgi:NDP-sugar pyrophosphorylase family protein
MDVTALLIIEPGERVNGNARLTEDVLAACTGGEPLAMLSVVGRPLVCRVVEALTVAGVSRFHVLNAAPARQPSCAWMRRSLEEQFKDSLVWQQAEPDELWQAAEEQVLSHLERRFASVLIVRVNAYFELGSATALANLAALPYARVCDEAEGLDVFWVSAPAKAQASTLLRSRLRHEGAPRIVAATYSNRLRRAADLYRLTQDTFHLRLAFRPGGREIRPGVWVGEHVRIHRTARIVAPAHIGDYTKIRAATLVTRGSSIEHHSDVDCGTVVQASNLLPYTYVGAGLEILHSVAGARHVASAAKRRTAEIFDAKFVSEVSGIPAVRLAGNAGRLASLLPSQILQGLLSTFRKTPETLAPDVGRTAIATRLPSAAETALAAGLAASTVTRATRDHGNE